MITELLLSDEAGIQVDQIVMMDDRLTIDVSRYVHVWLALIDTRY